MLLALHFVFFVFGKEYSESFIIGIILSIGIGAIIAFAAIWAYRRHLQKQGIILPILASGIVASILISLYYYKLSAYYREAAFHLTLAIGLVVGALLALSLYYAKFTSRNTV